MNAGKYRLRNWPLRSKQLVVILVPTITAMFLGFLRIDTELEKADEFSRTVVQADLSGRITQLVHDLQRERDLVVGRVASGKGGDLAAVTTQQATVDADIAALRGVADTVEDLDSAVQKRFTSIVDGLGTLGAIRTAAEQTKYPASDTLFIYENVVSGLLGFNREITRVSDDRTISEQAARIDAIGNAKEQLAVENSILRAASISNTLGGEQLARLRSAQAEFAAELASFQQAADPASLAIYSNTVAGPEVDDRRRLEQIAINRGDLNENVNLELGPIDNAANGTLNKLRQVEVIFLDDLRNTARQLIADARTNALRDGLFIAAALAIALILMLIVARSLLKPLRVLRRDALDVANHRLPATVQRILADPDPLTASKDAVDPVPIFTTEEVGQVARSFDAVQHQAVRMATEQAMMRDNINSIFVNLSRRSQVLVERQLGLLDRLERDEQDPDQLGSLFQLDHLATRMRRNSESLLVLSGIGLTRQMNQPVEVSDVIGAAVSEVEQYARIEVSARPDLLVQGRAVSDLVHLMAELLDNATFFSEPEKKVRVRVVVGRNNDLIIQITDSGVGMLDEEIAAINRRLADPPDLDVAVTRRMGLYVVSRLAKKHNILVHLRNNEDIEGGLVARITVPAVLITAPRASSATQPRLGGGGARPGPMTGTGPTTGGTGPSSMSSAFNNAALPRRGSDRGNGISNGIGNGFGHGNGYGTNGGRPVERTNGGTPDTARLTPPPLSPAETTGGGVFDTPRAARTGQQRAVGEEMTERLPIYDAVLSQWFAAEATGPGTAVPATAAGPAPEPVAATTTTNTWTSVADEGWQAARTLLGDGGADDPTTNAGLPKRVPKARLMPGSAAPRSDAGTEQRGSEPTGPVVPARSALAARRRMSSFQKGVRRGRHALSDEQFPTNGQHEKESQ